MAHSKKTRTIDGETIYLAPGLYELKSDVPNPHVENECWSKGTRFVVERHIDKIGNQNAYEHFSLRSAGSKMYLVKTYQTERWNPLVVHLKVVKLF